MPAFDADFADDGSSMNVCYAGFTLMGSIIGFWVAKKITGTVYPAFGLKGLLGRFGPNWGRVIVREQSAGLRGVNPYSPNMQSLARRRIGAGRHMGPSAVRTGIQGMMGTVGEGVSELPKTIVYGLGLGTGVILANWLWKR